MLKEYDLNVFYRESWDEENTIAYWSETISINPVIWTQDDNGVTDSTYLDTVIECTPEETAVIARHYSEKDYGSDWTVTLSEFLSHDVPERIKQELLNLPKLGGTNEAN